MTLALIATELVMNALEHAYAAGDTDQLVYRARTGTLRPANAHRRNRREVKYDT